MQEKQAFEIAETFLRRCTEVFRQCRETPEPLPGDEERNQPLEDFRLELHRVVIRVTNREVIEPFPFPAGYYSFFKQEFQHLARVFSIALDNPVTHFIAVCNGLSKDDVLDVLGALRFTAVIKE